MIMWNVLVFAVVGFLGGTAARLLYPRRQPWQILETLGLGVVGGLAGGMISWAYWPEVDGQFHSGNLVVSIVGAFIVIVFWAGVSYARSLGGSRNSTT